MPAVSAGRELSRARSQEYDGREWLVVCSGLGKQIGLIVDRIVDIANEAVVSRREADRPGVKFVGVVQNSVTEFLDVDALIRAAEPQTAT